MKKLGLLFLLILSKALFGAAEYNVKDFSKYNVNYFRACLDKSFVSIDPKGEIISVDDVITNKIFIYDSKGKRLIQAPSSEPLRLVKSYLGDRIFINLSHRGRTSLLLRAYKHDVKNFELFYQNVLLHPLVMSKLINNRLLAFGLDDGRIVFVDLKKKETYTFMISSDQLPFFAISEDTKLLIASGDEDPIGLWDISGIDEEKKDDKHIIKTIKGSNPLNVKIILSDGRFFVVDHTGFGISAMEIDRKQKVLKATSMGPNEKVITMGKSANENYLAVGYDNGLLVVYNLKNKKENTIKLNSKIISLDLSYDGSKIVVSHINGFISILIGA